MPLSLFSALMNYQSAIEELNKTSNIEEKFILEILHCRDALQNLIQETISVSPDYQKQVFSLDQQLQAKAGIIAEVIELEEWRKSFKPPSEAWWWYLDQNLPPHPSDRFDWLWKILNFAGWTVNLALITDIATRFIAGGTGVGGGIAILFPSLLSLLKAGSDFNENIDQEFKKVLSKRGIKSHWQEEVKLLSTIGLLLISGGIWFCLPLFSISYTKKGNGYYEQKNLGKAEINYQLAIALDTDNREAHYNLGNLYEDINNLKDAETEYLFALKGGLPQAYNNLARLYILNKQDSEAISLMTKLQESLNQNSKTICDIKYPIDVEQEFKILIFNFKITEKMKDQDRYSLCKNFGWAKLNQNLPQVAQDYLEGAIGIYKNRSEKEATEKDFINKGSAYCLMAQALEQQPNSKKEEITENWQECRDLASSTNREEDCWLIMANQFFENKGGTQQCLNHKEN